MTSLRLCFDLRSSPGGAAHADLVQAILGMCSWADGLGDVDCTVQLSEHHGSPDGYLPAPIVLAAAVAGATTRTRISMTVLAPFYDPVRLAEDLAVLDLVARGRVDLILAAGYRPSEFALFGIDQRDRGRRVEAAVDLLKRVWAGESVDHDGRAVTITPLPYQRPRPPIVLAGSSKAAARRAARIADGFAPTNVELQQVYVDELRARGIELPVPARRQARAVLVAVADDPDETWEQVGKHALHHANMYATWAAEAFGDKLTDAFGPENPVIHGFDDVEGLRKSGRYLVLTPDECTAWSRDQGGFISIHPLMGGLAPEIAWQSLRHLESTVFPALAGSDPE